MIAWLFALACTGTSATAPEAPAVAPATPAPPPAAPTFELPAAPSGTASAAVPQPAAAPAPGAPPANAADFEPISTPLGPRQGGGVKWGGVKTKSQGKVDLGDGEVYDPTLETTSDDKR